MSLSSCPTRAVPAWLSPAAMAWHSVGGGYQLVLVGDGGPTWPIAGGGGISWCWQGVGGPAWLLPHYLTLLPTPCSAIAPWPLPHYPSPSPLSDPIGVSLREVMAGSPGCGVSGCGGLSRGGSLGQQGEKSRAGSGARPSAGGPRPRLSKGPTPTRHLGPRSTCQCSAVGWQRVGCWPDWVVGCDGPQERQGSLTRRNVGKPCP